jgi:hypothetical protein
MRFELKTMSSVQIGRRLVMFGQASVAAAYIIRAF